MHSGVPSSALRISTLSSRSSTNAASMEATHRMEVERFTFTTTICKSANQRSLITALSSGAFCRPTGQTFKWRTRRSRTTTAISLGRWRQYSMFKPTSETVRLLETALGFRRSCRISPELRSRTRSSYEMPLWVATPLATMSTQDQAISNGRSQTGAVPIRSADAFSASA